MNEKEVVFVDRELNEKAFVNGELVLMKPELTKKGCSRTSN